MKKTISLLLAIMSLVSLLNVFAISASAATTIFPGSAFPKVGDTSNSCTVTLTKNKQASVYVWAYSNEKNAAVNIRMVDPSNNRVIWSEKSAFRCSSTYMFYFYQGSRTFYLGTDHKAYKLQFSSGNSLSSLSVKSPKNCKIA